MRKLFFGFLYTARAPLAQILPNNAAQKSHIIPQASVPNNAGVFWPDRLADVHQIAIVVVRERSHLPNHLDAEQRLLAAGGPAGTRRDRTGDGLALLGGRRRHCYFGAADTEVNAAGIPTLRWSFGTYRKTGTRK